LASRLERTCPDCGAVWEGSQTCQDYFYQFLGWEAGDLAALGGVHHLMVLCYHLQHPAKYSSEGLAYGLELLVDFVEGGLTIEEARRRNQSALDPASRTWKIRGTPASYGTYQHPIRWRITTAEVAAGGPENYVSGVKTWARATLEDLRESGNYTGH
jgi:hypothetical protein